MKLQPSDAPLDAFFTPVRRRHPEVDIVVLPAAEPTPPAEPIDEAQVAATLDQVATTAEIAWDAFGPRATAAPTARWRYGTEDGTVLASARASTTTPDGFGALVALRGALEAGGWRVRRLPGALERLSGAQGALRVQASYAEDTGALLLEVSSRPIPVGRARARELVSPAAIGHRPVGDQNGTAVGGFDLGAADLAACHGGEQLAPVVLNLAREGAGRGAVFEQAGQRHARPRDVVGQRYISL